MLPGIWADDDSDDDSHVRKFSKKKKNYTAPVNFIAGGIHQPGQKNPETPESEVKQEEDGGIISDSSE